MSERPQNKHLKPFKPGQSGNPAGKPKGLLTKDSYAKLIAKYSAVPVGTLRTMLKDESTTALDATVIAQILAAIDKGYAPDSLLAYSLGKPTETIVAETKHTQEVLIGIPTSHLLKAANGS